MAPGPQFAHPVWPLEDHRALTAASVSQQQVVPISGGEVQGRAAGNVLVVRVGSSPQQQDQTFHGAAAAQAENSRPQL